ncbi:MAG: hypothetical protein JXA79_00290 [Deltaproteobacteria bacterium]|nr:hypothetical protein [Deltaproteobacteria bacterium]
MRKKIGITLVALSIIMFLTGFLEMAGKISINKTFALLSLTTSILVLYFGLIFIQAHKKGNPPLQGNDLKKALLKLLGMFVLAVVLIVVGATYKHYDEYADYNVTVKKSHRTTRSVESGREMNIMISIMAFYLPAIYCLANCVGRIKNIISGEK